jgi:hypothetical protein
MPADRTSCWWRMDRRCVWRRWEPATCEFTERERGGGACVPDAVSEGRRASCLPAKTRGGRPHGCRPQTLSGASQVSRGRVQGDGRGCVRRGRDAWSTAEKERVFAPGSASEMSLCGQQPDIVFIRAASRQRTRPGSARRHQTLLGAGPGPQSCQPQALGWGPRQGQPFPCVRCATRVAVKRWYTAVAQRKLEPELIQRVPAVLGLGGS